jgi:thymidylate synthase
MQQLHEMYRHILDHGEYISNGRTKEGYYSVFGYQNRYNLREGFPATTTKKLFFRGIAVEMCWFLKGDTNVKYLQDNNVHIWDEWATKEQCAKFGRPEGELGPVYGKQWRKWEALDKTYGFEGDNMYTGPENGLYSSVWNGSYEQQKAYQDGFWSVRHIDQIEKVIEQIKTNPSSRRLIVTGWNPAECDLVALPPCHTLFQFKVSHGGTRLNCQLYQRSADAFLGVPFNIASYALLTHMIAQVTGLEVGKFVHTFGDLHIYENHLEQVKEQLQRQPMPLSQLWLDPSIKNIDEFQPEHIKLLNYVSHPAIKGQVAV